MTYQGVKTEAESREAASNHGVGYKRCVDCDLATICNGSYKKPAPEAVSKYRPALGVFDNYGTPAERVTHRPVFNASKGTWCGWKQKSQVAGVKGNGVISSNH